MLSLSTAIGEELTKIEFEANKIITPKLRKKNRIKTLAGTLEIEGNFMGEERITAMLDGTFIISPRVTKITSSCKDRAYAWSILSFGITHTGHPGPWINLIFLGNS
jgi:hypothetical protein